MAVVIDRSSRYYTLRIGNRLVFVPRKNSEIIPSA